LAGRNGNGNGLLQYYSFMTPITFTLAAYEVAKNVGWSSNDQILFLTGIFFGCYGLVRPPRLEGK
jgi:hypothetical protein